MKTVAPELWGGLNESQVNLTHHIGNITTILLISWHILLHKAFSHMLSYLILTQPHFLNEEAEAKRGL